MTGATPNESFSLQNDPPRLFEVFFDLHHPAASLHCQRARMVKPPEGHDDRLCAELCKPSFITNILCYAFPDFYSERDGIKFEGNARLNRFDVYLQGFSSQRHTFTQRGPSGDVLYGHVLRYLAPNPDALGRPDVGRRETRAMVLLTRAEGGERFFYAILKTLEACMAQSAVDYRLSESGNSLAEKAINYLHSVYRAHLSKNAELMLRIQRQEHVNHFDDHFMIISGIEWSPSVMELKRDRIVRGGWITFRLPVSLQPGYKPGIAPDNIDSPILPLLRCLSPENILNVLSGLLCERRIIFISSDITKLSSCVHAAVAMLAQGCLAWIHVFFPILPPHMLSYLSSQTPYLVGVLSHFVDSIQSINGMTDVLRVDLDRDELRTYNMMNPAAIIPEISSGNKKQAKPTADASSIGDVILAEIEEIQKTERRTWGGVSVNTTTTDEKNGETRKEDGATSLWGMLGTSKKLVIADARADVVSLLKPVRGSMDPTENNEWQRQGKPITQFDVCDNDRGEESIRSALLSFFLSLHGDLSSLLSEDPSTRKLIVDRRKYLRSKKRDGVLEDTYTFHFYRSFCETELLTHHVHMRVAELDGQNHVLLPHHQPLFIVCAKSLSLQRKGFTADNICKVVSKMIVLSPLHALADHHENVRAVAYELTAAQDADGDVLKPLRSIISSSYECDGALGQVLTVLWSRIDDSKGKAKQHLLALHLLKILLQNGPITTLSMVTDGFAKLKALKKYSSAKASENKEIQESAAEHDDVVRRTGWGSYLLRRLPITTGFKVFHEMLAVPKPTSGGDTASAKKSEEMEQPSEQSRSGSTRSAHSQASTAQSTGIQRSSTTSSMDHSSHSPIRNVGEGLRSGAMTASRRSTRSQPRPVPATGAVRSSMLDSSSDESKTSNSQRSRLGMLETYMSTKPNLPIRNPSICESTDSSQATGSSERRRKMLEHRRRAASESDLLLSQPNSKESKKRSNTVKQQEDRPATYHARSMSAEGIEQTLGHQNSPRKQPSLSERKDRLRHYATASNPNGSNPSESIRSMAAPSSRDRGGSVASSAAPVLRRTSSKSHSTEASRKHASGDEDRARPPSPSLSTFFLNSEVEIHRPRQGSRAGASYHDPTEESMQDSLSTLGFTESVEHPRTEAAV